MKIALHVLASPNHQANHSAFKFSQAAIAQGHQISRVFFSGEAAYTGNYLNTPPQDETNIYEQWCELSDSHGVELILCVAAALKRGILDETEAKRYNKEQFNCTAPFIISGLGQLVEAAIENDRLVTFGA